MAFNDGVVYIVELSSMEWFAVGWMSTFDDVYNVDDCFWKVDDSTMDVDKSVIVVNVGHSFLFVTHTPVSHLYRPSGQGWTILGPKIKIIYRKHCSRNYKPINKNVFERTKMITNDKEKWEKRNNNQKPTNTDQYLT